MARQCPLGTSITRPVRTRAIWRVGIVTSWAAARSKPAASSVPYAGRATVESSRLILSRIPAAYRAACAVLCLLLLAPAASRAQDLASPLGLDPAVRTGKLPNGITYY